MNGTEQVSNAWTERMRLIRLRRRKEKSRFVDEFRIVPHWVIVTVVVLFIVAQVVAVFVNLRMLATGGETWSPELRNDPVASTAGLMAVALATSFALRRRRVSIFWPYVTIGGALSWSALYAGGLHPALALVPIIPFLPHAARDPGRPAPRRSARARPHRRHRGAPPGTGER